MTDKNIKALMGAVLRNREFIYNVSKYFRAEDVENGILAIPEKLINTELEPLIPTEAKSYLEGYNASFHDGFIIANATLSIKQMGRFEARYRFKIDDLYFSSTAHKIYLTYEENVVSLGNPLQNMALKAVQAKGPLIETAAAFLKRKALQVSGSNMVIDLDDTPYAENLPETLSLKYL